LKFNGFYNGSYADVKRLLQKAMSKGIQGLILDLRDNLGGSVNEALNIINLF